MERHFKITVDGRPYDVVVEEIGAEADGHFYPEPGLRQNRMPAESGRPAGEPEAIVTPAPREPHKLAGPADAAQLVAPLGGVMVEIKVSPGQSVSEGDVVAVIEAMKMKTQVSAHRSGAVSAIHVAVGEAVEAGKPLLTIN